MEVSNIVAGTLLRANPFKGAHLSPSNSRFRVRDNNAPWAEEEVGILKQCLQPCSTGKRCPTVACFMARQQRRIISATNAENSSLPNLILESRGV